MGGPNKKNLVRICVKENLLLPHFKWGGGGGGVEAARLIRQSPSNIPRHTDHGPPSLVPIPPVREGGGGAYKILDVWGGGVPYLTWPGVKGLLPVRSFLNATR